MQKEEGQILNAEKDYYYMSRALLKVFFINQEIGDVFEKFLRNFETMNTK